METKTAIDLQKFCSDLKSPWNKNSDAPFSLGEFTYATDGHVIVRVPRLPDIGEVEGTPKVTSLPWDAIVTDDQWLTIDPLSFEMVDCKYCQGGTESIHYCPDCTCKCEDCDNGKVFKEESVKIGSKSASLKYLKLIQSLPALIAPDATPKEQAIPFKFDGGQGLLMSMR